jgi:hypothetical protein
LRVVDSWGDLGGRGGGGEWFIGVVVLVSVVVVGVLVVVAVFVGL